MFFGNETVYTCSTELYEIEPIIRIEMGLVLNSLQRLICHKTQITKPNQTKRMKKKQDGNYARVSQTL